MGIRDFILRLAESHKKTPEPEKVAETTPRLTAIETLLHFEPDQFNNYRAVNGGGITIKPTFENIEEYANQINAYARLVEFSRPIRPSQLVASDKVMTVEQFLVSKDGRYIDEAMAVAWLKVEGLELCRLLAKCEGVQSGFDEHNLRVMTNLLTNLTETVEALSQVGQMN